MENNENFVTEEVTENVEPTTEQTPKTYTQEEVNDIVGKRLARQETRIRKEYDRKYSGLEDVLKAGTGAESVEDAQDRLTKFWQSKGVKLPEKPNYSQKDIETLAQAEANNIISAGFEEVVDEVDRLTKVGVANMTPSEKALFKVLAEHRQEAERVQKLASIGVTEDVYNSPEFKTFASQFNPNTPVENIYGLYAKTQPKKDIKPMGSMKNTDSGDNGIKDYYSFEEAKKFTKADFDKNPALYDAVRNSMAKWK